MPKKLDHEEKYVFCHAFPSFESAKSPFRPQLTLPETPPVSHISTEGQQFPWRNQHRESLSLWNRYGSSTPRRDSKTSGHAVSSRECAQPFLLDHGGSEAISHVCKAHLESSEGQRVSSESPDEPVVQEP